MVKFGSWSWQSQNGRTAARTEGARPQTRRLVLDRRAAVKEEEHKAIASNAIANTPAGSSLV